MTLELDNLSISFGGVSALQGVSAIFQPGAITAIIGGNGAGKTTLLNLISGLLQPEGGEIRLAGQILSGRKIEQAARMGVGRVFQDTRAFENMTAEQNVIVALQAPTEESPLAGLFRPGAARRARRKHRSDARALLDRLGLLHASPTPAGLLSYGQKKRLAVARVLALGSRVLLLDEPAAGVDAGSRAVLCEVMREEAARGAIVVLVEHDLELVAGLAQRSIYLDCGRLIAEGPPAEVLRDPLVRAAHMGLGQAQQGTSSCG